MCAGAQKPGHPHQDRVSFYCEVLFPAADLRVAKILNDKDAAKDHPSSFLLLPVGVASSPPTGLGRV